MTLLARERYPLAAAAVRAGGPTCTGAVALGGAVLAASAALAVLRARSGDREDRRRAWTLAALTPLCALATAVTPLGPRLWPFILESMQRSHATMIAEWLPVYAMAGPVEIAFWVLAPAFVFLLLRRGRSLRTWSDVMIVAAAIVVLPLAVRSVRNVPPFLLLAIPGGEPPPRADLPLGPRARDGHRGRSIPASTPRCSRSSRSRAAAASSPSRGRRGLPMLGWRPFTPDVIAAVRACPGPLYNRYNEGGFLIWFVPGTSRLHRQPPGSISPRLHHGGGPGQLLDARPAPLIARWGLRCALLPLGKWPRR